ncbi:FIST C-terminal domain-containing protein [Vibrio sp. D404a]|uniref:FIST signal transduction protein n=1 Tax=unclassified Vibrio TaxID=2614977 RepID=UPI002555473A|nr:MULTISPECIES: FIST N-terminal domain-containing protein [unclassified Vibrio]MDK9735800.1 FIST C-terminal domain-containing protein [Vibrio sp. D404a]MDK9796664.1 FIST C-terminal domain-containing protein [Vibrio sp. D449a]
MKFLSNVSYSKDNTVAVKELLSGLERPHEIACLICYCTEEYSTFAVQELLKQALPDTPIHGCTTCHGIMTETGFHSGPVIGVLAIYDSGINAYGSGIQTFSKDITDSTHRAIDIALEKANRQGEVPDLILLHSTPGNEETVMNAIDTKFGTEVPIIGGSAADNKVSGNWSIFTEDQVSINGVSLTVFFSSQSVFSSLNAGHTPTQYFGTVTKARDRILQEIDNKPAVDVYNEWTNFHLGNADDGFIFEQSSIYPLGRKVGSSYKTPYFKLSHSIRETECKGIELFTDISEGDVIYLMQGSRQQIISRAANIIHSSYLNDMDHEEKLGAINIFCAGPMLNLKQDMDEVCEQINQALNGLPYICPFTFGEQGRLCGGENAHGNLMVSSATFYRLRK